MTQRQNKNIIKMLTLTLETNVNSSILASAITVDTRNRFSYQIVLIERFYPFTINAECFLIRKWLLPLILKSKFASKWPEFN